MRAVVRSCALATLVCSLSGVLGGACGDDDDGSAGGDGPRDGSAADASDAARPARDGGGGQADPKVVAEYRALLDDWVVEWDRIAQASCECFVMIGAYKTVEECVALTASGPDWAKCASQALAAHDANQSREDARCVIEELGKKADCIETSACAEITMCETDIEACPLTDSELVNVVLAECPDTGLLGRL